jgi:molybdate transport system regulatory protein
LGLKDRGHGALKRKRGGKWVSNERNIDGLVVCSKKWIEVDGEFAIGDGGGQLLTAIEQAGSLAEAARQLGWSYRHAWGYLRRAEGVLQTRLVLTHPGKGAMKGTRITSEAKSVMRLLAAG